jgi:hypothetical protein
MKRSALHRKRHSDPVSVEDRADVLSRDRGCVLASLEPGHVCRDQWGERHDPDRLDKLTLEHVKAELRMGVRAPSTPDSMVALCYAANLRPPTKAQRTMFREYLAGMHA